MTNQFEDISDITYLMSIIENHQDDNLRIKAISRLKNIKITNPSFFKFLENLAISDDNNIIRAEAFKIIITKFLKSGRSSIEWIINSDNTIFVIFSILTALKSSDYIYYKELKVKVLQKYIILYKIIEKEAKFFMDLEFFLCKLKLNSRFKIGCLNWGGGTFEDKFAIENEVPEKFYFEANKRVRNLSLKGFELTYIPKSIGNLTRLKELNLSENNLITLPRNIKNLKRLRDLNLENNKFKNFPKSIVELKKLDHLYLKGNKIKDFPNYAMKFIKNNVIKKYIKMGFHESEAEILRILEIFNDPNEDHPNDKFARYNFIERHLCRNWYYNINKSGYITELGLRENDIGFLLNYICNLTHLKRLYLIDCNIKKIPGSIKKLKFLKYLGLGKNQIDKIPKSIKSLKYLEDLSFGKNRIKKVPYFLKKMKKLRFLNIKYNQIKVIPEFIKEMKERIYHYNANPAQDVLY